jgi:molybdate transport system substrate-binding protein
MRVARRLKAIAVVLTLSTAVPIAHVDSVRAASSGEIVVSAAASLQEGFTELAKEFRRMNPRSRVRFNFGSSTALVTQIQSGAPVAVFASADLASQDRLLQSGHIASSPRLFARNTMQLAVKPGNPLKITRLADLVRAKTVALCGKTVPCGLYAGAVLSRARVNLPESSITRGLDAKATVASVAFGDADAAIVYATDVIAAGKSVRGVAIPPAQNVKAVYGISVVRGTKNQSLARAFVDFVMSKSGRGIMSRYGFLAP